MVKISCYGGGQTVGGNRFLVEFDSGSLFLDFGQSYTRRGEYFEEYLQPRSATRLHDLLELGMLPELDGIYRQDALQPNGFNSLDDPAARQLWEHDLISYSTAKETGGWTPDAVFLSHAHLDHAGCLPYLGPLPTICSAETEIVLDTISQIGSRSSFDDEFFELEQREMETYNGGYFPGEYKISKDDPVRRPVKTPSSGETLTIDGTDIEITTINVSHSIPGARMALIESDGTKILYTGDFRFHGREGADIGSKFRDLDPDILMCEGTRTESAHFIDEGAVAQKIASVIESNSELAMIGFDWKDMDRYRTALKAAKTVGRKLVVDARTAYLRRRLCGDVYKDGATVFLEGKDSMLYSKGDYTRSKYLLSDTNVSAWSTNQNNDIRHFDQGVAAVDISEAPEEYLLHLNFYRIKHLLDIDPPEGSVYIRSQSEPFTERMELSEKRLRNWLKEYKINPGNDHQPYQIHTSGHAARPELQFAVDTLRPDVLIPIHSENPHKLKNNTGDKQLIKAGQTIEI